MGTAFKKRPTLSKRVAKVCKKKDYKNKKPKSSCEQTNLSVNNFFWALNQTLLRGYLRSIRPKKCLLVGCTSFFRARFTCWIAAFATCFASFTCCTCFAFLFNHTCFCIGRHRLRCFVNKCAWRLVETNAYKFHVALLVCFFANIRNNAFVVNAFFDRLICRSSFGNFTRAARFTRWCARLCVYCTEAQREKKTKKKSAKKTASKPVKKGKEQKKKDKKRT